MATAWTTTLTDGQKHAFAEDGVVHVPNAVDADLLAEIKDLADRQLADPGPWVTDTGPEPAAGRLFTTRYLWRTEPAMQRFVFESGIAELAAVLMGSSTVRFYFDHLLVKEPGTESPTPWHQDIPYWPFLGQQICSVWVACTKASVPESSLEFVRGSHRWGRYFAPEPFTGNQHGRLTSWANVVLISRRPVTLGTSWASTLTRATLWCSRRGSSTVRRATPAHSDGPPCPPAGWETTPSGRHTPAVIRVSPRTTPQPSPVSTRPTTTASP